ncbi:hypothetical protein E2C01_002209 [Portunus trituberculatus]|uniref:Uncharacterized protein n=1 Tax=Portunus trituberculatus TaxID=210409 RepID=A0A5B7CLL9_PORTR|nr:hypothetical protein [Portunus trituberculatus]
MDDGGREGRVGGGALSNESLRQRLQQHARLAGSVAPSQGGGVDGDGCQDVASVSHCDPRLPTSLPQVSLDSLPPALKSYDH